MDALSRRLSALASQDVIVKDGLDELIQVDRRAEHVLTTHTGKDEQIVDQLPHLLRRV